MAYLSSRRLLSLFHSPHRTEPFKAIASASFFSWNSPSEPEPGSKTPVRILITGGTDGIGKQAVLALAQYQNFDVTFTGRNKYKGAELVEKCEEIARGNWKPVFLKCDFSVDGDVVEFADKLAAENFDVCIFNHGVMYPKPTNTASNRDTTMMTNLVSSYMIAHRIIEGRVPPERPIRLVFTTSRTIHWRLHRWYLRLFGIFNPKNVDHWKKVCEGTNVSGANDYVISKTGMATLAESIAMDKKIKNVKSTSVHPGIVFTNLMSTLRKSRQIRAACILHKFGTAVENAGQYLLQSEKGIEPKKSEKEEEAEAKNAKEEPSTEPKIAPKENPWPEHGRYYFVYKTRKLPSFVYSEETIAAFNNAMNQMSHVIRDDVKKAKAPK